MIRVELHPKVKGFVLNESSLLQFYAFSTFAMQLNELEKHMEGVLPPTDSRLRPDIRAMENGDIGMKHPSYSSFC